MQKSHAIAFPLLVGRRSVPAEAGFAIAGSLVIALAAQVAIPVPFSPVPLTLQPLAVLLVGAFLGPVRGAAAASLYLLEGLAGVPVFAGARGGLSVLLGPTAGYLYAFPAAAFVAGLARGAWPRVVTALAGATALIHLGGWSWLASAMGLGSSGAFASGVAPFLLNDVVKIAIAATAVFAVQSRNREIAHSRN